MRGGDALSVHGMPAKAIWSSLAVRQRRISGKHKHLQAQRQVRPAFRSQTAETDSGTADILRTTAEFWPQQAGYRTKNGARVTNTKR